jgi:DNA-binding CsgD family transcriptional regulator
VSTDRVAAGRAALAGGRWEEARAAFAAAVEGGGGPDALDGLGESLWWLGEPAAGVEMRERAYAAYRRAGAREEAALAAMAACIIHQGNFGNAAAAGGWMGRAERLFDGDAGPLQGWLWATRAYQLQEGAEALDLAERALARARRDGDVDLELTALSTLGRTLVSGGRVRDGLALVDEAMAGTLGGEGDRLDTVVTTSCDMLIACDLAADLDRATQWCRVADDFIATYGCPFLYAECRTLYGGILVQTGRWAQAEDELATAIAMAGPAGPAMRNRATTRLADLRLRQGRVDEAEDLLAACDREAAAVTLAAVRLARGQAGLSAALVERHLRAHPAPSVGAVAALEILVGSHLVVGDLAPALVARAAGAEGRCAAAAGDVDRAVACLERALAAFARCDLPLERARARRDLASAVATSARDVAVAEARAALAAFDDLGASADADATAALLRALGVGGRTGPRDGRLLTRREREVLALVGQGLSNPEIAARLFISRKTAEHHVSSLLTKLGVPNRAAAAAAAARVLGA